MPLSPPSPQTSAARPILFVLKDNTNTAGAISIDNTVQLYIRPEDLTRTDSSRLNAQQTLGDTIWADNFGAGMPTINIAGHTGWRRPNDLCTIDSLHDGIDRFIKLKKVIFTNWHAQRQLALKSGNDPDASIQLEFVDHLDRFACVVAPMSFVLRRSRSRPLLMQYQISMIVLNDQIALPPVVGTYPLTGPQKTATAFDSILASINAITAKIASVRAFIDNSIATPIAAFLSKTAQVFAAVMNAINAVQGVTHSLIAVARLAAQCGVNIFRSLAAITTLPNLIRRQIMELGGAFSNILCVLENALVAPQIYADYDPLFGSSNCSSTSGGRPPSALAGLNPFQYTHPQIVPDAVVATIYAQSTMRQVAAIDVVRSPPSLPQIGSIAAVVAAGILVTVTPGSVTTANAASAGAPNTASTASGPAWAAGPPGVAGPVGPAGPMGPVGTTFIYRQIVAVNDWIVTHNLARFPGVTVVDTTGTVVESDVQYVDANTIALSFTVPVAGYAYFN